MEQIYQSAILQALGWAIADSIWQMALLWLLYQLCVGLPIRNNPVVRHLAATIALFIGGIWFIGNVVYKLMHISASGNSGNGKFDPSLVNWMESLLPYLSSAYLVVLVVLMAKFVQSIILTQRLRIPENIPAQEWQDFVDAMALRFFIDRKVFIQISETINVPATIGFVKPVILLPIASVNNLSVSQVEAIIMHELAHIKRYDYLINLIASFIETLVFFNPFTYLLSSQIRKECELCCDDAVLSQKQDPGQYAYALLLLEKSRQRYPLMVAATGKETLLLGRVKRILNQPEQKVKYKHKLLALVLVAGLIMALSLITPYHKEKNELPLTGMSLDKQLVSEEGQPNLPMMMKVPIEEIKKEMAEDKSGKRTSPVPPKSRELTDLEPIQSPALPLPPRAPAPPTPSFSTPSTPPANAPFAFDYSTYDAMSPEVLKVAELDPFITLNGFGEKELKTLLFDMKDGMKEGKFDVEMAGKLTDVIQGSMKMKRIMDSRQNINSARQEKKKATSDLRKSESRQRSVEEEYEKAFNLANQNDNHQWYTEQDKARGAEMKIQIESNWRMFEQDKIMADEAMRQNEKSRRLNELRGKKIILPAKPVTPKSRVINADASPEILYRAITESHATPKVRTYKDESGMTISIVEDEKQIRIHFSSK
jgi:beta-lactamase regulating signal transducer with metallopeptidase domain